MTTQTIGILSDTHLTAPTAEFIRSTQRAFARCSIIVHAGDLSEPAILDVFADKQVVAVHGNMCSTICKQLLPGTTSFSFDRYTIAVLHGHTAGPDIEGYLLTQFSDADAIIFGHTHRPVVHRTGRLLLVNPGSFRSTGRHGAPGTYAIMAAETTGLTASIHELPPNP